MHAKVSVGVGVHSKLKDSTVFLDFQIRILNFIKIRSMMAKFFNGKSDINLLTPNVNYRGRTAPLTSKVAFYIRIQQI